jgi:ABC-type transport system involved in multi-copper enzyme maturation permease subunit
MLGPHFMMDMLRLARKGRTTFFRVLYVLVQLVALYLLTRGGTRENMQINDFARMAQTFSMVMLVLQNVLIVLLSPIYFASVMAEERELGTLELLALTHLTDWEILLGKLGARVLTVASVVLAGLPMLAIVHLWGGVDLGSLVFHVAASLLLILSCAGISLWASVDAIKMFDAFMMSASILVGAVLVSSILVFALAHAAAGDWMFYGMSLLCLGVAHLIVAWFFCYFAVQKFRHYRRMATTLSKQQSTLPWQMTPSQRRGSKRSRIHPLAWPIEGNALKWKECTLPALPIALRSWWAWGLLGGAVLLAIFLQLIRLQIRFQDFAPRGHQDSNSLDGMFRFFACNGYVWALLGYTMMVVFQTTASVARERELLTLDFLLQVPHDRLEILGWKWVGPLLRNWPFLAVAWITLIFGFLAGFFRPMQFGLLFFLPLPWILCLSALALYLSTRCARTLNANLTMAVALAVMLVGHLFILGDPGYVIQGMMYLFLPEEMGHRFAANQLILYGALALESAGLLLLALLFGFLAKRRFEQGVS